MPDVIVHYTEGYPTRLTRKPRLARMLATLGPPASVRRIGPRILLEWDPIFPGVPVPEYSLEDPWRMVDRAPRTVRTVELAEVTP